MNEELRFESHNNLVGYPVKFFDNKKLDDHYVVLKLRENNFLKSVLNINLFDKRIPYKNLREHVDKTDCTTQTKVAGINAWYDPKINSIRVPARILQGILFDSNRPRYMNYGAIGVVIGHEITHGFDHEGREFDKDGNFVEWWDKKTEQAFLKKVQCIINQYGNYTVPELNMKLDGERTQGETIADNGGIKDAYLAYDKWVQGNDEEAPLPGLNYTGRQIFWISAGNVWCTKIRKEKLELYVLHDVHPPPRYKVIGPLSNSDHFANDFKCPKGSKMNPEDKCEVW